MGNREKIILTVEVNYRNNHYIYCVGENCPPICYSFIQNFQNLNNFMGQIVNLYFYFKRKI